MQIRDSTVIIPRIQKQFLEAHISHDKIVDPRMQNRILGTFLEGDTLITSQSCQKLNSYCFRLVLSLVLITYLGEENL